MLTQFWILRLPLLQPASPASLAARKLQSLLHDKIGSYTFVDFCAGAGGPTPYIEREINGSIKATDSHRHSQLNGVAGGNDGQPEGVTFVLTDIFPHIPAWSRASAESESGRLSFVPTPVDASRASKEVIQLAKTTHEKGKSDDGDKMFRLFNLAFHHFDDELATKILRNTLQTSDGFAIFELQGRDVGNLFTVLMMTPIILLYSWWWFWGQWTALFWTYVIPVVPFVTVYDGVISCLRTRRPHEVMALLKKASADLDGQVDGWHFQVGEQIHSWPTGTMSYFVGIKG